MPDAFSFRELLGVLEQHRVDYLVVGGLAGVLHGSPIPTEDVDIVHARTPENIRRLLDALRALHAAYRNDPRGLAPGESHLQGPGHQLLQTTLGQLDVLGSLGQGLDYPELASDAQSFDLGGFAVRAISLDRLIAVKRALDRPKDKLHLLQLLALQAEAKRKP